MRRSGSDGKKPSGLATTADRHGFFIASPNGGISATRGYVWNIPGVPTVDGTLPPKEARDDVAYLTGLVDRLVATNPIDGGGAPYWQYPQTAALQRWATLNGCVEPYARTIGATVYEQGYARCRGDSTVAARVRRGGPHAWSVVDNEALWAFLSRHSR